MATWNILREGEESSYENNNFVKSPDINRNDETDAFKFAIKFLRKVSNTAASIIHFLDKGVASDRIIDVIVTTSETAPKAIDWQNCWVPFRGLYAARNKGVKVNPLTSTIRWWAGAGKCKKNRSCMLGLMHELGHEYQWRMDRLRLEELNIWRFNKDERGFREKTCKVDYDGLCRGIDMNSKIYISEMENWVVANVETPVAKEINDFYKQNKDNITKYYDILLEPTRNKYKDKAQVEMGLFLDRTKAASADRLKLGILKDALSGLIR